MFAKLFSVFICKLKLIVLFLELNVLNYGKEKTVHDKIRLIRSIKGMSQENVALDLGFSQRTYSKIERGETQVSIEVLNKLVKLFDMKPEDILNFNPEHLYKPTALIIAKQAVIIILP